MCAVVACCQESVYSLCLSVPLFSHFLSPSIPSPSHSLPPSLPPLPQVCITTVGVVGDLCRALEKDFVPLMNDVMQIMLENLSVSYTHTHTHTHTSSHASKPSLLSSQNPHCHRRVKPHILSTVGDVALATGEAFKPQLELVLKILQEAANAQVDRVSWRGVRGGG